MPILVIICITYVILGATAATIHWAVVARGKLRPDLSLNDRWAVLAKPAIATTLLWPAYLIVTLIIVFSIIRSERKPRQGRAAEQK